MEGGLLATKRHLEAGQRADEAIDYTMGTDCLVHAELQT